MRIEDKTLYIEEPLYDDNIEDAIATFSQDNIQNIEVLTNDLGAGIVQELLVQKRQKDVIVHDDVLKKIFENVIYKSIE